MPANDKHTEMPLLWTLSFRLPVVQRWRASAPLLLLAACTYGPPQDHLSVQNVALKPDGSRLAVVVRFERSRSPTGLAAFPDGGVPKVLEQRADVYVVSLPQRALLAHHTLSAPEIHRVSFNPWLMGWEGDQLLLRITGCAGAPGDECYGPLVKASVFAISAEGRVAPDTASRRPALISSINSASAYVSVGVEPYGVSIATQPGQTRTPLLQFSGQNLQPVQ